MIQRGTTLAIAAARMLSVLLLALMVAIVTLNVLTRYLLHVSLSWSAELARYCLVWSALLAAVGLVERGEHLTVDLLERRLGRRSRHRLAVLVALLSLTFFAVLIASGTMLVAGTIGQVASSIERLPMSVVYAIVPVAALLMFGGCAARLRRLLDCEEPGS
jgi:TRAP-type C4-dicarboxylate transport system permease small subunit